MVEGRGGKRGKRRRGNLHEKPTSVIYNESRDNEQPPTGAYQPTKK